MKSGLVTAGPGTPTSLGENILNAALELLNVEAIKTAGRVIDDALSVASVPLAGIAIIRNQASKLRRVIVSAAASLVPADIDHATLSNRAAAFVSAVSGVMDGSPDLDGYVQADAGSAGKSKVFTHPDVSVVATITGTTGIDALDTRLSPNVPTLTLANVIDAMEDVPEGKVRIVLVDQRFPEVHYADFGATLVDGALDDMQAALTTADAVIDLEFVEAGAPTVDKFFFESGASL